LPSLTQKYDPNLCTLREIPLGKKFSLYFNQLKIKAGAGVYAGKSMPGATEIS
jgi:hypothetical protein